MPGEDPTSPRQDEPRRVDPFAAWSRGAVGTHAADEDTGVVGAGFDGEEIELLGELDPPSEPTPPSTTRRQAMCVPRGDPWPVERSASEVSDWREVAQLPLPVAVLDMVRDEWGIERLHPPQAKAMPAALAGDHLLLAIPTASGKSLVAYLAMLRRLLVDEPGTRAVYIVPLKALASEKVDELSPIKTALGLRIGLASGDRDGETRRIKDADILVCTSEKLDSMLRQDAGVLDDVSTVTVDELHLMDDPGRGPTLEMNLARVRHLHPETQLIGLSATVGNAPQIAEWLGATLITSTWRPVRLEYGTLVGLHVEPRAVLSPDGDDEPPRPPRTLDGIQSDPLRGVLLDVRAQGGQLLTFVASRRAAQSVARKLADKLRARLADEEPDRLARLATLADTLRRGEEASDLGDLLASAATGGVAFHHAGLTARQRSLIERAFRDRLLLGLAATPTLAAGVNLPARRVVVRDLKRFADGVSDWLPTMEVQQMLGRAGRPRHDDLGEAWIVCKHDDEAELASERYLLGDPEPVCSRLALEPPMRMHLLAAIATGGLEHRESIRHFFAETFLGHTQPAERLDDTIDRMLQWLIVEEFIERAGPDSDYRVQLVDEMRAPATEVGLDIEDQLGLAASDTPSDPTETPPTPTGQEEAWDDELPAWARSARDMVGVELEPAGVAQPPSLGFRRASELDHRGDWTPPVVEAAEMRYRASSFGCLVAHLCLDPLTASQLRTGLRRAVRRAVRAENDHPVTDFGLLHLLATTIDFTPLHPRGEELGDLHRKAAVEHPAQLVEVRFEDELLSTVKTAWVLESWADEASLRTLEAERHVVPGDLRVRVQLAEWLLLASQRIVEQDEVFIKDWPETLTTLAARLDILRRRIQHGCRADLLPLISLRGVGRVRGRQLAAAGVRTLADLEDLSSTARQALLRLRGWSRERITELQHQVSRLRRHRGEHAPTRRDDEPLERD